MAYLLGVAGIILVIYAGIILVALVRGSNEKDSHN
jgi:hypothetical protein